MYIIINSLLIKTLKTNFNLSTILIFLEYLNINTLNSLSYRGGGWWAGGGAYGKYIVGGGIFCEGGGGGGVLKKRVLFAI